MIEELLAVFCLLDEMVSSTCLSQSQSLGGLGAELMALDSISSMNRLATKGIIGEPCCTMDLFIILTLEEEVGVFQAEFQQCGDALYGHGGPAV